MARKSTLLPELPSWASAFLAAALAFLATWGALRATVAGLQTEVAGLRSLVQTVAVLEATSRSHQLEIDRQRDDVAVIKAEQQHVLQRVSALEARKR